MTVSPAIRRYGIVGSVIVILLVLIGLLIWKWNKPPVTVHILDPNVKTIEIDKIGPPIISYLPSSERATVTALLEKNKQLNRDIDSLTVALAKSSTPPQIGPIVWTKTSPTTTTPATPTLTFSDGRLNFTSDGKTGTYTLNQNFSMIHTVSKNEKNIPEAFVELFELGPDNQRTPIHPIRIDYVTKFTTPKPHWYARLGFQVGIGRVSDANAAAVSTPVFISAPWLKRGRTIASEDTRWAIFTPVMTTTSSEQSYGVFPVSLNIGALPIPYSPLTNIWVSPYIGTTTGKTINRLGFAVSATF